MSMYESDEHLIPTEGSEEGPSIEMTLEEKVENGYRYFRQLAAEMVENLTAKQLTELQHKFGRSQTGVTREIEKRCRESYERALSKASILGPLD